MAQAHLSSLAYDRILQRILSFELVPGTALQERSLAAQLEISRTPVREALHRLTHEGWVQNSFKRNVMEVKPISDEDIEELFEIRQLLELRGVERIFEDNVNASVGGRLMNLSGEMKSGGVSSEVVEREYMDADTAFHGELMYFNLQSRLGRFWHQINLEFIRLGVMALKSRDILRNTMVEEHDAIVTAILHRRKKAAREAVRHHNEQTRLHIFKSLPGRR